MLALILAIIIFTIQVIHRDIKPENVLGKCVLISIWSIQALDTTPTAHTQSNCISNSFPPLTFSVSRLGVIKLCDFGFARPYLENETLTDYVATRWYRSPELLVGDRYGKEVDIWAVGCLYSEMMTGEPLFPGESDIDQLFQIVRILGKLSPRHQILIMRNAMFRGMKQEQNTTLIQMFPNWNRDSIDFLIQCLKMDGNTRPDAEKVLIHDLFTRDNFLENFLSELRGKLSQEMQVNPLLKRIPSYGSSGRWNSKDDKKLIANDGHAAKYAALKKTNADDHKKDAKANEKLSKLNLSILSTQFKQSNSLTKSTPSNADLTNYGSSTVIMPINTVSTTSSNSDKSTGAGDLNHNNGDELYKVNYLSAKQRTSPLNLVEESSQQPQPDTMDTKVSKIIMINSLLFKDSIKFDRVRSAKLQKSAAAATTTAITSTMDNNKKNQMVANSSFLYGITSTSIHPFDLPFHASHAPMSLQSLQPDSTAFSSDSIISNHMKRLSPAINTTTTITTTTIITTTTTTTTTTSTTASTAATHFSSIYRSNHHTPLNSNDKTFLLNGQNVAAQSHRRHSNVLGAGDQIMLPKSNQFNKSTSTNQVTTNATRIGGQMVKRERNLIDSSLKPFTNAMLGPDAQTQNSGGSLMTKEPSPRILPPPQWLTGNLKLTSHG